MQDFPQKTTMHWPASCRQTVTQGGNCLSEQSDTTLWPKQANIRSVPGVLELAHNWRLIQLFYRAFPHFRLVPTSPLTPHFTSSIEAMTTWDMRVWSSYWEGILISTYNSDSVGQSLLDTCHTEKSQLLSPPWQIKPLYHEHQDWLNLWLGRFCFLLKKWRQFSFP